tara:strand:+ start:65 stop:436 length:372 start_codon:yes stop_codon:yes gene_type:complete
MKSIIATGILLGFGTAAVAGPYANVETNAGWLGTEYSGQITDIHLGYEGDLGESADWYVQGGPALVGVPGEALERRWSAKSGVNVSLTKKLGAYGEVSALTADKAFSTDNLNLGVKAGVKYTF